MKKIVAILALTILIISMTVTAFAGPTCPECQMEGRATAMRISYSEWISRVREATLWVTFWEERTVTVTCPHNASHSYSYIQKRNEHRRMCTDVN